MTTTTTTATVRIDGLICDPRSNQTMRIVAPESYDRLPDGTWFVAMFDYTGVRNYCRFTGRTRRIWGADCPTIERYFIETTADSDGVLWGTVGARNNGTTSGSPVWVTRPQNVTFTQS